MRIKSALRVARAIFSLPPIVPDGRCGEPGCNRYWDDHILVGDGFLDDEDVVEEEG